MQTNDFQDKFTPHDPATGTEAVLERTYDDGHSVRLTGDRAYANAQTPAGAAWRAGKPGSQINALKYRKGDMREGWEYQLGAGIRNFLQSPANSTAIGRFMSQGPTQGALAGGGGGALLGLLAGLARTWATGEGSPLAAAIFGGLGGAMLGGYAGQHRQEALQKQSAMYQDDRNFILEKLTAANDVTAVEKAKLAAAVRNLDATKAKELAGAVRAALGFGVGAIIAKFIFGQSGMGVLFGGLAGVLGGAQLMSWGQQSFGQPFLNPQKRLKYSDIL